MESMREKQLCDVRKTVLRIGGWLGEDVYQDVCIFAYGHDDINWNEPQQGRLIRLAHVINGRYRQKIRCRGTKKAKCFSEISNEFDEATIPDRGASPTPADERRALLGRAIDCLPLRRRLALEWFIDGRSDEEAASILGIRKDLLRQWRHRDARRLQSLVKAAA